MKRLPQKVSVSVLILTSFRLATHQIHSWNTVYQKHTFIRMIIHWSPFFVLGYNNLRTT